MHFPELQTILCIRRVINLVTDSGAMPTGDLSAEETGTPETKPPFACNKNTCNRLPLVFLVLGGGVWGVEAKGAAAQLANKGSWIGQFLEGLGLALWLSR
jgi:hypothetical protein